MDTGDTIYIPEPGTSLDSHLWVIVSDPIADPFRIVLVNFTSHADYKDQACALDRGDHSFISHKTCVEYRRAKVVSAEQLEILLKMPQIERREPLRPDVLQRIWDGVPNSRMSLEVAQLLADQNLVQL